MLWKNYKTQILIFGVVFVVHALYATAVQMFSGSAGFLSHSDAEFFYYRSAINLLEHHAFSVAIAPPYIPDAYHTPLYSLFVAALLAVGTPLIGIMFVQAILSAATALIAYELAQGLIHSRPVAIAAGLITGLEPMSIYWGGLLMSDTLFGFLMALAMWLLMRKRSFAGSIVLGLATLTRPITLFFAPVYLALLAYQMYADGVTRRKILEDTVLAIVLFLLAISPWLVRNQIVFNVWSMTSAGWYEIYVAPLPEFAESKGIEVPSVQGEVPEKDVTRFDFKYSPAYQAAVIEVISHDPFGYLVVHAKRSLYSFVSNKYDYLVHVVLETQFPSAYNKIPQPVIAFSLVFTTVLWLVLYAFAIASFMDRRLWPWLIFLLALFGINAGFSGSINPGGADMSRYNLGLYPLFFVFVAHGFFLTWSRFTTWLRSRSSTTRLSP